MAVTDKSFKYKESEKISQRTTLRYSLFQEHGRLWMSLVLMISDTTALVLSFLVSINLRVGNIDPLNQYFYVDFLWIPVLLMLSIYANQGLYPGIGLSPVEEIRRLSLSTCLLFLLVIALTFLLKLSEIYSRLIFLMAWLVNLFFAPLVRNMFRILCVWVNAWGESVGVAGFPDRRVVEVADFFVKYPNKGISPKVIFLEKPNAIDLSKSYQIQHLSNMDGLPATTFGVKTILFVVPNWNWVSENIDKYRYTFERVILIQQQRGSPSLSNSIAVDFNGVIGLQIQHNLIDPRTMALKRLIDLTVAGLSLVVLFPLLALFGVLIHFDSPGGIFYWQDRLGKGGKSFRVLKFRSMYTNSDQIFEEQLRKDKKLQEEWKTYQKLKRDPRITRVGGFMRKYSLDELPQLWNIIKGEMSLVGPRPILISQKQMYGPTFQDYCQVRPGVTGLWQVSGRNHTTFERRAELDIEYIQRWSIWLDIYIILQTFKEVYFQDGAY